MKDGFWVINPDGEPEYILYAVIDAWLVKNGFTKVGIQRTVDAPLEQVWTKSAEIIAMTPVERCAAFANDLGLEYLTRH